MAVATHRAESAQITRSHSDASQKGAGAGLPDLPHPDELPDIFAATCVGKCLEPAIADQSCLVFDKREPVGNGDFVCLMFRPGFVPPGETPGMVKRLVSGAGVPLAPAINPASDIIPLIFVEMLNPPRTLRFKATDVIAMIKCVGLAISHDDGRAALANPQPEWATIAAPGVA
ncbi:MAG: hypothetical protein KKD08_10335 [Alphaproteobacteria bacterium]|jgi:hypothetical protein|nr:hypothetical protein [Alphaproteobacteria bacterium]